MITSKPKPLRRSDTRESIYAYLLSAKEHPSAEMVYEALKGRNPTLSPGTVYRNLKQLEDAGRIIRVTSTNDRVRYDACTDDHVHFVCTTCYSVVDMFQVDMQNVLDVCHLPEGFRPERYNLVISGVCPDCLEKNKYYSA